MAARSRKKILLALIFTLLLGLFLPPNINGNRFSKRLAAALTAGLGRRVEIGHVSFRVLPRPGFDLYDFKVIDQPEFGAEPLLMCGQVTADLRLTSLWQGRLEIANLRLQNSGDKAPPSLNLVYANGHWNLESLLLRAEQVPTAPTTKKRAEQRSRFPYIEADAGRINFKIGPEKKPYALTNTDFALWLAAEDQWHVRLEGRPVRIDMNLSDTGKIKIEGDLKRSAELRQTPVKLQLSWQDGQLGQLSSLVMGQDKGWRGTLGINGQMTGSINDLHLTAGAALENLRRYDIERGQMMPLQTRCQGEYSNQLLDFNCDLPVSTGALRLNGKLSSGSLNDYDLSLAANRLPLSALTTFLCHAKRTLPEDLTAVGTLDAAFGFHAHQGVRDWHGTGMTTAFVLRSAGIAQPIEVSAVRFSLAHSENQEPAMAANHKKAARTPQAPQSEALIVDPFAIQLGPAGSTQAQGSFAATGYSLTAKGTAGVERILDLGRVSGFPTRIGNVSGVADFNLTMSGVWSGFSPAHLAGTAHVRNVEAVVPGVKDHLLISATDAQFTDAGITLTRLAGQFQHSPVAFSGSISKPWNCQSETQCALQFDLQSPALSTEDVATLLGAGGHKWSIPFLSNNDRVPDFRAAGTVTLGTLKLGETPLQNFVAHLEVTGHAVIVNRISAKVAGGTTEGSWRIDWSSSPVRYAGSGTLTAVSAEHTGFPVLASWITGRTNLLYSLDFKGDTPADMLASSAGKVELNVANGISQALVLENTRPTRFQAFQGNIQIENAVLKLLTSKFKAENRIYDVSGTVSLTDKQAKLMVSDGATRWAITGDLDKPVIAAQRPPAQEAAADTR